MRVSIRFDGVMGHLSRLEEEKKTAAQLREALTQCYRDALADPLGEPERLRRELRQIERVEKSISRRIAYLEDLVREFRTLSVRTEQELRQLERGLSRMLDQD